LHRFLVGFEEQSIFALEMLENRPLGDAELRGDVFDACRIIARSAKYRIATSTIRPR